MSSLLNTESALCQALEQFGYDIMRKEKKALCIALCNAAGELCLFLRMPGAAARGIDIAIGKAYTAAIMECPTTFLQQRLTNENLSLADFCNAKFTAMPGGEPISHNGRTIGGVGLSGCPPTRDAELARLLAGELGSSGQLSKIILASSMA